MLVKKVEYFLNKSSKMKHNKQNQPKTHKSHKNRVN